MTTQTEKKSGSMATRAPPSESSISQVCALEWTDEQEHRARRKVDSTVLPLLVAGLLVFQFDRMNLASALTDGFAEDVHLDQNTINLGNQLLFVGTVVLEIPAQMVLSRVGARIWMSGQVLLFGLVGTLQVLIRNRTGFIGSRLCLGLAESGYIPGAMFTISIWYTRRERARRIAVFFFGMFGGNALSPLLASGILKLGGKGGLAGWQWLYLLEGVLTFSVATAFVFFLPESPASPKPLLGQGIIRFSDKDRHVLQERHKVEEDWKNSGLESQIVGPKLVWKALKHWQRWPHFLSSFCVFSTWSPLTTYTPSIIMSLDFDRTTANALAAVGALVALAVVFIFAIFSDLTDRRGLSVISAQACYLCVLVVARCVQPHVGRWARWGLWTAINGLAVGYHPVHNTWLQLNCRDAGERSISIAMWVMLSNTGMMAGARYFSDGDKPLYQAGLRIMIMMASVGMALAVLQEAIYIFYNKRATRENAEEKEARVYVP